MNMEKNTFIKDYFERISYDGGIEPCLTNLTSLQKQHSKAIPFENTYILKKIKIKLTKEWIYDKIINKVRGGVCFEVNYLFYLLLKDLNYDVKFLGGRVFQPTGELGPHNEHVLSMVTLDGKSYIVDVGFGAKCAQGPLLLTYNEELKDQNGLFRFTKENDVIVYECRPKTIIDRDSQVEIQSATDTWQRLYQFKLRPIDIFETKTAFDFHTTSPLSPFTGGFFMARFTDIGKTSFLGNVLTVYSSNGNMKEISKQKEVPEDEFDKELSCHFGLWKLD